MRLLARESEALGEFCRWVREHFGERVDELSLFGSRARGEGSSESDLDVLVVIDALTSPEARDIARFRGDVLTRHDVLIAPFALSRERYLELRARERRIIREIDRDGVPL